MRTGSGPPRYEVIGIAGLPEVHPGADIARLVVEAAARQSTPLAGGDLLVVGQKIVSKAEGRIVRLADVTPSSVALGMATGLGRDPRLVEVILRESRRVVRMDQGVLITETHHGWVCANAGVDQSNVDVDCVALLPEDPDGSARALRDRIRALAGVDVFVIVADTFGRPWREGLTNVAIGLAGLSPLRSYLGERDPAGRPLQATILAVAAELAEITRKMPIMGESNMEAAKLGAVVVLALPASGLATTLPEVSDACRDKVVISTVVALAFGGPRLYAPPPAGSSAEEAQGLLPGAKVVAAFHHIAAHELAETDHPIECDLLLCGDDQAAKDTVAEFGRSMGLRPIDVGPLSNAGLLEGITAVLATINRRYKLKNSGIKITGL